MSFKQPVFSVAALVSAAMAGPTFANDSRVVGGVPIVIDDAPSIVGLLSRPGLENSGSHFLSQFCAGTLIADTWVLTAAHCVAALDGSTTEPAEILAIANTDDLNNPVGAELEVVEIIVHPDYFTTFGSDIALLRLGSSASAEIAPLNAEVLVLDESVTVAGWGATMHTVEEGSFAFPSQLNAVDVAVLPGPLCNTLPAYAGIINETMVCAGFPEGGRDTCQGDSGGPLYRALEDGVLSVAGITSFGEGCALENRPGVYTDVIVFTDWIRSFIGEPIVEIAMNPDEEPEVIELELPEPEPEVIVIAAPEPEVTEVDPINVPIEIATNDDGDLTGVSIPAFTINSSGAGSAGGWMLALLAAVGVSRRRQQQVQR